MINYSNDEVQKTSPSALGLVAMFLAGAGVATAVAILSSRLKTERPAKAVNNVLSACDRAMQQLESRIRVAG